MAKIVIEGNICSIKNEDDSDFLRKLDNELSFKIPGAEHTKAYKGFRKGGKFVRWDGIHRILTSRLTFPYGLLDRVSELYRVNSRELFIEDKRPLASPINSIDILPRLKEIGKNPYPYQLETLETAKTHDHGIIRASTGAGKTLIAALITAHFGKKTIIYVISTALLYQLHSFFSKIFPDQTIGIIGDGNCDIQDINIASVWTVGQALGIDKKQIYLDSQDKEKNIKTENYIQVLDLLKNAKLHIFDECHICAAPTLQAIAKKIKPEYIYGMSASPWRDDNSDLLIEGVFGPTIVDISASYLIKRGFLVKPYIKFQKVPKIRGLPKNYQTVYKKYIIENKERNQKIVHGANRLVEQGFKPLVLYSKLNHGKMLYEQISKEIPSVLLSGKDSQDIRDKAAEQLENNEIQCIVASTIFDIGVDLPKLSGLIIAGGGKSSVRALQRIGRVIRYHPDKACAAVIDYVDDAPYLKNHSLARYKIYSSEEEFSIKWPK